MITLIILSALGILTLFAQVLRFRKGLFPVILVGLAAAFYFTSAGYNADPPQWFSSMLDFNGYAISFTRSIIIIAFLWFMMARNYFLQETSATDHFALVIFSLVGAVCMVSYNNLTMLFLGIEILSLSAYVLAASDKGNILSNESGFKYFLMGSFATGFLLFGITLIYGVSGSFDLHTIASSIALHEQPTMALIGILLLMVGLSFKTSLAPFHFWAPDVYDGAPTPVTAYMATVVKTAAFGAFFRLFFYCFPSMVAQWSNVLWWLVVLTLFIANITAVRQTSVKRMLAYSSIAHAGYLAMAIVSMNGDASGKAILYYTLTYSISTITAFTVLYVVSRNSGREDFGAFEGLAKTNPFLSFVIVVAMLSLAGIPPTAGFIAKYYIFSNAMATGNSGLVIIAVLAALVGVYYYFRVIIAVYFKPEQSNIPVTVGGLYRVVLFVTTLLTIVLGLYPDLILKWM
ncbi:MAG TPA: NADH-quinone oxidoreductase subunit N [Bacteroidia bacterium]|nr:NADH-quinone oxidoreductase subunit N [Bacteroidia bacterium]